MLIFRLRLSYLSVEKFSAYGQVSPLKKHPSQQPKNTVFCGYGHPAKLKVIKLDYLPLKEDVNSFFRLFFVIFCTALAQFCLTFTKASAQKRRAY